MAQALSSIAAPETLETRALKRPGTLGVSPPGRRVAYRRNAMTCARCQDIRWICEEHPDKPMEHDGCKGSGMPCPDCNPSSRGKVPVLPPDFEIDRG